MPILLDQLAWLYNVIYILYIYISYHVILYITEFFLNMGHIQQSDPWSFLAVRYQALGITKQHVLDECRQSPGHHLMSEGGDDCFSRKIREVPGNFWLKENHDIPHTLWNWWWWWWWCNLWFILLLHINSLSICLCLYGGFILNPSSIILCTLLYRVTHFHNLGPWAWKAQSACQRKTLLEVELFTEAHEHGRKSQVAPEYVGGLRRQCV